MTDQPTAETQVTADVREARAWLNRAEQAVLGAEDYVSATGFAQAAAQIGTGYAHLAAIEQAAEFRAASMAAEAPMIEAYQTTALLARRHLDAIDDALVRREAQAVEEARPHDGPVNLCESDADAARRFAGRIGAALEACEPHPLLHSYTQRHIAEILRGEEPAPLTGVEDSRG